MKDKENISQQIANKLVEISLEIGTLGNKIFELGKNLERLSKDLLEKKNKDNDAKSENVKKFISLKHIPKIHPAFSMGALRHIVFNEKYNGATSFIKRVGSRVLVDLQEFEKWISEKHLSK